MIGRGKIAGALYGVAIGDAIGRPTEFMPLRDIHKKYGRHGMLDLPDPALFTDDTQMTLAVARAMDRVRWPSRHEFVRTLRTEFIRWAQEDEPRAPGTTCLVAINRLKKGGWRGRWVNATEAFSKGCGANMRTVPPAFIRHADTALGVSQLQAAMTHGHPTALAATELTALAVRWVANGVELEDLPRRMLLHANQSYQRGTYRSKWLGRLWTHWPENASSAMRYGWKEVVTSVVQLNEVLRRPHETDICAVLGGGWVAEEALVLGTYFAVRFGHNPVLAVSEAARTSGDSDSIASITGAILGAAHGEKVWPSSWRERIERRDDIENAIDIAAGWAR